MKKKYSKPTFDYIEIRVEERISIGCTMKGLGCNPGQTETDPGVWVNQDS